MQTLIKWDTLEYHHTPKNQDWYISIIIISITLATVAILLNNILFGLFIIISCLALCIHTATPPKSETCTITSKGILFKGHLFPYNTLKSFWVDSLSENPILYLTSVKTFMPHIGIPINENEVDPEGVRIVLLSFIKEVEQHDSILMKGMRYLGF